MIFKHNLKEYEKQLLELISEFGKVNTTSEFGKVNSQDEYEITYC